jgi:hypothetical protein
MGSVDLAVECACVATMHSCEVQHMQHVESYGSTSYDQISPWYLEVHCMSRFPIEDGGL